MMPSLVELSLGIQSVLVLLPVSKTEALTLSVCVLVSVLMVYLQYEQSIDDSSLQSSKSKAKAASLRAGFTTLKKAVKGQATKTSTMLSKVKTKRTGLSLSAFRKGTKDKGGKPETSPGASDVAPTISKALPAPSVTVTSPISSGPDMDDPEGLYEVSDNQDVYEAVNDVSSGLSISSMEGHSPAGGKSPVVSQALEEVCSCVIYLR